jgi:glucokinase
MREIRPAGGPGVGELFQLFRDARSWTRSELAEQTGLSRNTVAARVDALLAAGLLAPVGSASSSGGRPPAQLGMNPRAGLVLAIDLGATHATVAVTDLSASVLTSQTIDLSIDDGPERVLDAVFDIGERLLAVVASPSPLLGVGIGLPGPVEYSTGRPVNPPIMPGWDGFDVPGYVGRRFPVTVLVDNDVNILALGEHALSWPAVDDLIFVKVATGIGAGIILGRELQRGAQGGAGDIGHVQVPYSRDSPRPPGDESILGDLASGAAIARLLRARGVDAANSRDVIALMRANHPDALEIARQAGREIGEVLAAIVNTLNPSVIVLGGSVGRASEPMLAGIREVVYRRSITLATQQLQIVPSNAGSQAGVLGAAMLVVQQLFTPQSVTSIVTAATGRTAPVSVPAAAGLRY